MFKKKKQQQKIPLNQLQRQIDRKQKKNRRGVLGVYHPSIPSTPQVQMPFIEQTFQYYTCGVRISTKVIPNAIIGLGTSKYFIFLYYPSDLKFIFRWGAIG